MIVISDANERWPFDNDCCKIMFLFPKLAPRDGESRPPGGVPAAMTTMDGSRGWWPRAPLPGRAVGRAPMQKCIGS